uniref:U10-Nephitoxin-Nsp1a_1 n=1 Tax=Nephila sp. SGP-2016 TaxID=1905176 RepID=A0A4Q8K4Q3_9ARAC
MHLTLFKCVILAVFSFSITESAIHTNEEEQGKGFILTHGQTLVLQCNNTDNPSAKVQWLKNGLPLNSTEVRVKEESSNNSLIISDAIETDCGNYTCKSLNQEAIIPIKKCK